VPEPSANAFGWLGNSRLTVTALVTIGGWWSSDFCVALDYLAARVAEPCGRAVPWDFLKSLMVVESIGEFPVKLSQDQVLIAEVNAATLALSSDAPPRRQAPDFCLTIIIALELAVVDSGRDLFGRYYAGCKLIKVAAAMRWNDTEGIRWGSWMRLKTGLQATITRSKTTGPGKKVDSMAIHISEHLTFSGRNWVGAWWDLCQDPQLDFARDYLVPLPGSDGKLVRRTPAVYADAVSLTKQLMSTLLRPIYLVEITGFTQSEELLLLPGIAGYWTEHSERRWLNARAAELDFDKAKRDYIGRWLPQQSDNYLMTARAVVLKVQRDVCAAIISDPGRLDETECFLSLKKFMEVRGYPDAMISGQLSRLHLPPDFLDGEHAPSAASAPTLIVDFPVPAGCKLIDEELYSGPEAEKIGEGFPVPRYIISYTRRRKCTKLHKVMGGCYRKPGREIRDYDYVNELEGGENVPLCKDCWPTPVEVDDDKNNEDSDSGNSSSSTEADD
jgi:hypothetical protein